METMTNELTVVPRTIGMVTRMMDAVNIEDAVIVSEEEQKEHPNFIESNTSGITLEELERNCIVSQLRRQPANNQPPEIYPPGRRCRKNVFYW